MSEFPSFPRASTPRHRRLQALRAYVRGEEMLDAGEIVRGSTKLEEACRLAPELDDPEWPPWATFLYQQLDDGLLPLDWPPLLTCEMQELQPQNGGCWWAEEMAITSIVASLRSRNHVIIDGFLGRTESSVVRSAVENAWNDGVLTNSQSQGYLGSDHTTWADASLDKRWEALSELEAQGDKLVAALLSAAPDLAGTQPLSEVSHQCPLVCRYNPGAELAWHSDNPNRENRRWLTAVYYVNVDWKEIDGGVLRLYGDQTPRNSTITQKYANGASTNTVEVSLEGEKCSMTHKAGAPISEFDGGANRASNDTGSAADDAVADVAPIGDRLVLFFSDMRSPHEVLKANAPRYATTLWYTE